MTNAGLLASAFCLVRVQGVAWNACNPVQRLLLCCGLGLLHSAWLLATI